jgi:hypothetical protein
VPDRDVFPGLQRSWRPVGRAVKGGQPADVVGCLAEKALAEQLRRGPFEPRQLAQAAALFVRTGAPQAVDAYLTHKGDPSRSSVMRALRAEIRATTNRSGRTDEAALVEGVLRRVAKAQLETLRPDLVGRVFPDVSTAQRYLRDCAGRIRHDRLASQIVRSSGTVRAPRRPHTTTRDLLYEPLT